MKPATNSFRFLLAGLVLLLCQAGLSRADELSKGQKLYLPVYSHVWHGDRSSDNGEPMKSMLSALVSIRNTSLAAPIRLTSARYYSTEGRLLKEFIPSPRAIAPMETFELFIERKEIEGGSGANFVIQWDSDAAVNPPVVEAVHINNQAGRSYSFITTARVVHPENGMEKRK